MEVLIPLSDPSDAERTVLEAISALGPLDPNRVELLAAVLDMGEWELRGVLDTLIADGRCQSPPLRCPPATTPPERSQELARRALAHLDTPEGERAPSPVELARLMVVGRTLATTARTDPATVGEQCAELDPAAAAALFELLADLDPSATAGTRHRLRAADLWHHAGEHRRSIEVFTACLDTGAVPRDELDAATAAVASALLHLGQPDQARSVLARGPGGDWSKLVSLTVRFLSDGGFAPTDFIEQMEQLDLRSPGHHSVLSFAHACRGDVPRAQHACDRAFAVSDRVSVIESEVLAITDCMTDWLGGHLLSAHDRSIELLGASSALVRALALYVHASCSIWQGDPRPTVELARHLGQWPMLDLHLAPIVVRVTTDPVMMGGAQRPPDPTPDLDDLLALVRSAPDHPLSARGLAVAYELAGDAERPTLADEIVELAERVPCPLTQHAARWVRAVEAGDAQALDEACSAARAAGLVVEANRSLVAGRSAGVPGIEHTLSWTQLRQWAERQATFTAGHLGWNDSVALADLTPTERRLAELVAMGKSHDEIGAVLFLSPGTVRVYASRLYRRLGVRRREELARLVGLEDRFGNAT